jgi:hypothetical protein
VALLALAVGWGRAGRAAATGRMPSRYVLLAAPGMCAVYFALLLYGRERMRRLGPAALALAVALLFPLNTHAGLKRRAWFGAGFAAFEHDLAAGASAELLARRHHGFMLHWDEPLMVTGLRQLHDAGIGPLARGSLTRSLPPGRSFQPVGSGDAFNRERYRCTSIPRRKPGPPALAAGVPPLPPASRSAREAVGRLIRRLTGRSQSERCRTRPELWYLLFATAPRSGSLRTQRTVPSGRPGRGARGHRRRHRARGDGRVPGGPRAGPP